MVDLDAVRKRLDALLALGEDWDGYGALEVEEPACERVMRLLEALPASCPAPWVVPTRSAVEEAMGSDAEALEVVKREVAS